MKLRITGTSEEVKELLEVLPLVLDVSYVSGEYPNRGSNDVRVYADVSKLDITETTLEKIKAMKGVDGDA